MTTLLDNNYIKSATYGHLSLNQRIAIAAEKVANGELVNFRGASVTTYAKVMRLANRIKQERQFPECPCEECK
jgi:hypothetical protein